MTQPNNPSPEVEAIPENVHVATAMALVRRMVDGDAAASALLSDLVEGEGGRDRRIHFADFRRRGTRDTLLTVLTEEQLPELACQFAERVVIHLWDRCHPEDLRPRRALEMKRAWLRGEINDETLISAYRDVNDAINAAHERDNSFLGHPFLGEFVPGVATARIAAAEAACKAVAPDVEISSVIFSCDMAVECMATFDYSIGTAFKRTYLENQIEQILERIFGTEPEAHIIQPDAVEVEQKDARRRIRALFLRGRTPIEHHLHHSRAA